MVDWNSHMLFDSSNYALVKKETTRVLSPFNLQVTEHGRRLAARLDYVRLGAMSAVRLAFGADVSTATDPSGDYYFITLPLAGESLQVIGTTRIEVNPDRGSVLSPTSRHRQIADRSFSQLILRLKRERVTQFMARLRPSSNTAEKTIEFDPVLDLRGSAGDCWRHIGDLLTGGGAIVSRAQQYPLVARQLEEMVMAVLFTTQDCGLSDVSRDDAATPLPHYILRAERYMAANLATPLTIEQIVSNAGASRRTVFEGFRRCRGATPLEVLRDLRLNRIRDALLHPDTPDATVTDVAFAYGFSHLGTFSGHYYRKFGELPSATLKSGKSSSVQR